MRIGAVSVRAKISNRSIDPFEKAPPMWRTLIIGAVVALCPLLASAQSSDAQQAPQRTVAAVGEYHLGSQDKVRLRIVAWRPARDEVFEWKSIDGEYVVGASGIINLPLIGDVQAAGATINDLGQRVAVGLQKRIGLVETPDVAVEIVKYRPFYIVGEVSHPGEYEYRPGLKVIQALAIAGGKYRAASNERMMAERDYVNASGELRELTSEKVLLLARMARLQAELDSKEPDYSKLTIRGKDDPEITAAIAHENYVLGLRRDAMKTRDDALNEMKKNFVSETAVLSERLNNQAKHVALEQNNVEIVGASFRKNVVPKTRWIESNRLLDQADADTVRIKSELGAAKRNVSKTESEIADLHARFREDTIKELVVAKQRFVQVEHKIKTDRQMKAHAGRYEPAIAAGSAHYMIIREGQSATEAADEATLINPGDTVKIEYSTDEPDSGNIADNPPGKHSRG